jgi:hypothetical protein
LEEVGVMAEAPNPGMRTAPIPMIEPVID